jgi:hypothetical protein
MSPPQLPEGVPLLCNRPAPGPTVALVFEESIHFALGVSIRLTLSHHLRYRQRVTDTQSQILARFYGEPMKPLIIGNLRRSYL